MKNIGQIWPFGTTKKKMDINEKKWEKFTFFPLDVFTVFTGRDRYSGITGRLGSLIPAGM